MYSEDQNEIIAPNPDYKYIDTEDDFPTCLALSMPSLSFRDAVLASASGFKFIGGPPLLSILESIPLFFWSPVHTLDSLRLTSLQVSNRIGALLEVFAKDYLIYRKADFPLYNLEPGDESHCIAWMYRESGEDYAYFQALVYPPPKRTLAEVSKAWLLEPMPETWVLLTSLAWESANIPSISTAYRLRGEESRNEEAQSHKVIDMLESYQSQPGKVIQINGQYRILHGAQRISDGQKSRLEWLWSADEVMKSPLLYTNPSFHKRFGDSVKLTFFMLGGDQVIQIDSLTCPPANNSSKFFRPHYLLADSLAVLSTSLGFTNLSVAEVVLLLVSWWAQAYDDSLRIHIPTARRTSLLLSEDIAGRLVYLSEKSEAAKAVWSFVEEELLRRSRLAYKPAVLVPMEQCQDMYYPSWYSEIDYDLLWNHKWLYRTIRLAAQQIGIALPETYHPEALEGNRWLGI